MASHSLRQYSLSSQQNHSRSIPKSSSTRTSRNTPKVELSSNRGPMDLPDRFKDEEDDDADDGTGVGDDDVPLAQQSVYGMLAATQSSVNLRSRFQQDSGSESSSDGENEVMAEKSKSKRETSLQGTRSKGHTARKPEGNGRRNPTAPTKSFQQRVSEQDKNLARSFIRPAREWPASQAQDLMSQSQILPSRQQMRSIVPEDLKTDASVLDRKLQAMAKAAVETPAASKSGRGGMGSGRTSAESLREKGSKSLAQVIANIFQFEDLEEVVSEFPCWYLQNVLLQGFMYVTEKHVCFYSYLQKKTNIILKSGHLAKQGRHRYGYSRYWFILKGDIFSYYKGSAEPYFPIGSVDLRYAISADISKEKGNMEEATEFTVTTPARVYYYRAETPTLARDWVKQLQKVIFRSHNDSDSVKISLLTKDILDVEPTSVVDFAETVKLRVIADDETFAVDEYFFTFFSSGKNALNLLKGLASANGAAKTSGDDHDRPTVPPLMKSSLGAGESALQYSRSSSSKDQKQNKAQPKPSHGSRGQYARPVTEDPKARSDLNRKQTDSKSGRQIPSETSRLDTAQSSSSPKIDESTDSFVTTSELDNSSSSDEMLLSDNMSASQMLTGDGVFRNPTLSMPPSRSAAVERLHSGAEPSSRDSSSDRTRSQATEYARRQRRQDSGEPGRVAGQDGLESQSDAAAPGRLVRGIPNPLQHAKTVAGMVRSSGIRMGSYLSSSPKTYIDNWSAAIAGGKRHYAGVQGLTPDDSVQETEQEMNVAEHEKRFQEHFGLPASEKLFSVFYCWLHKTVPLYGKIYMGARHFCFRSLWYGTKTKLIIPYKDILNVQKQRGFRWGYPGMVLVIRGYEELFFDFPSVGLRDDAAITVLRSLETQQAATESIVLTEKQQQNATDAAAEHESLRAARRDDIADDKEDDDDAVQLPRNVHQLAPDTPPILFDDPSASVLDFKPKQPMRITCLTIGSRGDVQPYIALCKGLQAEGHICKIATHLEFKSWVETHGIEFAEVTGDPAELMRVCVENGMFTPSFFLEVNSTFRVWLDDLLQSAWSACKGSDLLIESPSAMCGIHIAEALEIPYFRAFTMPWTRTRAYPHAFAVPNSKMGGGYNYMTYTFFDNIFWQAIAGQINRWRGKTLSLGPTSLDKLQQNKVPFLYNFSPNVVVPPLDFSDWIRITGYWFLDEGEEWEPPESLAAFIQKARDDGQKLVYIGFGSVTVSDSRQLVQQVIDAVVKADVRCILAKGWSDRYDKQDPRAVPIELPDCIHQIRSAPHDWLFKQVDAVVHHGGAGTTGASLRAGKPTIIKPFFGDQFFFATRVEDLGVGMYLKKVTTNQLGKALWIATHDARMRAKAAALGESIRGENGVQTAINAIYRDLDYAKTLIKKRGQRSAAVDGTEEDALAEDTEENWTFIEKEGEAESMAIMDTEGDTGVVATR